MNLLLSQCAQTNIGPCTDVTLRNPFLINKFHTDPTRHFETVAILCFYQSGLKIFTLPSSVVLDPLNRKRYQQNPCYTSHGIKHTAILQLSGLCLGQPGWAGTRRYISPSSEFSGAKSHGIRTVKIGSRSTGATCMSNRDQRKTKTTNKPYRWQTGYSVFT